MSDVGKTIAGVLMVGAGIALQFVPVPGVAQFAGLVLMSAGTSLLSVGLFGLPEMMQGAKISITSTQAGIPIVYGECKVSHAVADTTVAGVDNQKLYIMGAICLAGEGGQGIESIEEIYLYPDETSVGTGIEFDTNDTTPKNGGVAARYVSKATNWYKYQLHSGKDTQVFDAWLDAVGVWDETFYPVGLGLAWAAHWFLWDKDEEDVIWARGTPRDIQYLVHGCLLYDPRYPTDGPNSDGWIWDRADNPALTINDNHPGSNVGLQLLDYLTSNRYGMGIPYAARDGGSIDEINEASFEALADHCDETVTTVGLSPNITHPRYTSDVVLRTGDSHKTNLEKLLSACNSMLVFEGGKFKVVPRKVTTAQTYEITEEKIVGTITVLREGTTVPNTIKVRFPDKDTDYNVQEVVWPEPGTNDFLVADNNFPVERVIDLPCTVNWYQAQQLAMITLREMREDVTVEVTVREDALQLSVGDIVKLTYDSAGWSQKEFWVVGMSIKSDDLVLLQLNEYDSGVYSLDPQDDRPTTPGTNLPDPFTVTAATAVSANCAAGYYLNDGVYVPRVDVTWTHSIDAFAVTEELVYKKNADTDWIYTGKKVPIADTAAASWEMNLEIGEDYDFGVVVWNTLSLKSAVAQTASPCTLPGPNESTDDVAGLTGTYTCLEGVVLSWDLPTTPPPTGIVIEVNFYAVEIREQGAGATELDRWNAGTKIAWTFDTRWNLPYDEVTTGTYNLSVRRTNRFGNYSTGPTEINLTNSEYPCSGFGENDPSEYGKIIHNPGFESGGRWWYGPTGAAISGTSPIAESNSLTITAGGAERWVRQVTDVQDDITLGVNEEDYISVEEGDYMFLAAYGATTGATATVRAKTYDKDGVFQSNITFFTFTSSTAERKKNFVLIPAGIEFVVVEIAIASGSGVGKFDNFAGYLFPPRLPTVKEVITYPTAASGKLEIDINIAQSVLISVEMKKFEDQVWDAGWTDVTPSPYDMTVALSEKHNSAISYRVGYDLTGTGEGTTEYLENSVSFDLDTLPELSAPSYDLNSDDGSVILHWAGDDDVASIKYETKAGPTDWTDDDAARTAAQGGTPINNRSGSVTLSGAGIPVPASGSTFVAVLAYTGAGGTGTESTEVYRAEVTRGTSGGVTVPTIQSQLDYSGSNGTITLVINDPQTRVTLVEWRSKSGLAAWSSWTTDTGPPDTYNDPTVALAETHDSHIAWRVTYTDPIAGSVLIEGAVTFDIDTFPEINSFTVNIDAAGAATLAYHGDDDVGSIKWSHSTSVQPNATTVRAESCPGRCNDARSEGALALGAGTIAEGDTLFVSFFAYTGTGAAGTESVLLYEGQATRPVDTKFDTVPADVTGFTDSLILKLSSPYVILRWTPVTTAGVTHYEIRKGGTGWSDATLVDITQASYLRILFGELPTSAETYRIKAINALEGLESANAATTTVSYTNRPDASAITLISSYWRGGGGLMRFNLSSTNATMFRFHWGTSSGFTPNDTNVLAVIMEPNPTADYAVGLSMMDSGWTDDQGRTLYMKVGVKDGLSDELSEGWDYSSAFQFVLNPFELTHVPDGGGFRRTLDTYVDSSGRVIKLFGSGGEIPADDVFDKAVDTYVTIGAQGQVTYSISAPGSPNTGDIWVDTDDVPVSINRWTGSIWDKIGNLTEGALALLDQVDTAQIVADAVTSTKLAVNAVYTAAIQTDAITNTKIDDNAVDTPQLNAGAITSAKIEAGAVIAGKIGALAVDTAELVAGAVTAGKIQTGTITATQITGSTLSAIYADVGILTAGLIQNSAGVNFIDLDATGTQKFIAAGSDFSVTAAGVATFGGTVTSTSFTGGSSQFTGSVQVTTGGSNSFLVLDHTNPTISFGRKNNGGYDNADIQVASTWLDINWESSEKIRVNANHVRISNADFNYDEGTNHLRIFDSAGDITAEMYTAGNPPTGGTNRGYVKWHDSSPYEIELKNPIMVTAGSSAGTGYKSVYAATSWLFLQSPTGVLIDIDSDNNSSTEIFRVRANKATTLMEVVENGNIHLGSGGTSTSRTTNFMFIPTTAGTPTGAVSNSSGRVAFCFDTSANRLWVRDGSTWRYSQFT